MNFQWFSSDNKRFSHCVFVYIIAKCGNGAALAYIFKYVNVILYRFISNKINYSRTVCTQLKTQLHNQRMSQQFQHAIQEIVLPMIQQLQLSFELCNSDTVKFPSNLPAKFPTERTIIPTNIPTNPIPLKHL